MTEEEYQLIESSINLTIVELQKDALSAIMYDSKQVLPIIRDRMERYESILKKLKGQYV